MAVNSTILIVDDSLSARKMVQGILGKQGYQLAFAADGQEGLALAAQLRPDVIERVRAAGCEVVVATPEGADAETG